MSDLPIRKRKTKQPCPGCGMNPLLCFCDLIPRIELKTRICLLIHHRELRRTTNTGQLAHRALVNSEIRIRGQINGKLDLTDLIRPDMRTLLFYPSDNAILLNHDFVKSDPRPILLIVPDGNWRQASKVQTRHPELANVPRVKVQQSIVADHFLRAEHKSDGMATLEAIANALAVIEDKDVADELFKLYQIKLQRTLRGRGEVK